MNSRLDNIQAAILHLQFKDYDSIIKHRRALAVAYQERLGDLKQLQLPPAPDADKRHFDVYQNYELEADRRDELKAYLKDKGIGTLIQWGGKAVHQFERLGLKAKLPVTFGVRNHRTRVLPAVEQIIPDCPDQTENPGFLRLGIRRHGQQCHNQRSIRRKVKRLIKDDPLPIVVGLERDSGHTK